MAKSSKNIYCKHCGSRNKPDAEFCEYCGKSLDRNESSPAASTTSTPPQQQRPGRMGGNMPRNRWLFILIPVILLAGYFIYSAFFAGPTYASNLFAAGQEVLLSPGYVNASYNLYNFTLSSGQTANVYGEFVANTSTLWVVGLANPIDVFFLENGTDVSSISQDVIANSTTGKLNFNITAPGNYLLGFWGSKNFSADEVIFPNGMNITLS